MNTTTPSNRCLSFKDAASRTGLSRSTLYSMLADDGIEEKYPSKKTKRDIHLYGKEINDETYAICKSDMMIKGNNPENIKVGSTLSSDEFAANRFDFMLSNPPYGKSWASEQKYIKDGNDVIDARFKVSLKDYWGNPEVVR
jgi:type I restriction enzyme M protein